MKWRRWNHILHRDIGYFCIGLTIIYAVSGIAVNHISHSFNPSYIIEKSQAEVTPQTSGPPPDQGYIDTVLEELAIKEPFKNGAMLSPEKLRIFTETYTIDINLKNGTGLVESVKKIPVLYEFNYLHLNKGKGIWTWIADIYGAGLCILAITGILMIRGQTKRRSILLTLAGVIIPTIFLIFMV